MDVALLGSMLVVLAFHSKLACVLEQTQDNIIKDAILNLDGTNNNDRVQENMFEVG